MYHTLVRAFETQLIERVLPDYEGNRSRAARALGLQRTYFLRLIRERGIRVPRLSQDAIFEQRRRLGPSC